MKYLLVVAHPDDEVLGAGASMWRWSHNGNTVDVAIMCTEAKARAFRPEDKELDDDLNASAGFLGKGVLPACNRCLSTSAIINSIYNSICATSSVG